MSTAVIHRCVKKCLDNAIIPDLLNIICDYIYEFPMTKILTSVSKVAPTQLKDDGLATVYWGNTISIFKYDKKKLIYNFLKSLECPETIVAICGLDDGTLVCAAQFNIYLWTGEYKQPIVKRTHEGEIKTLIKLRGGNFVVKSTSASEIWKKTDTNGYVCSRRIIDVISELSDGSLLYSEPQRCNAVYLENPGDDDFDVISEAFWHDVARATDLNDGTIACRCDDNILGLWRREQPAIEVQLDFMVANDKIKAISKVGKQQVIYGTKNGYIGICDFKTRTYTYSFADIPKIKKIYQLNDGSFAVSNLEHSIKFYNNDLSWAYKVIEGQLVGQLNTGAIIVHHNQVYAVYA